MARRVRVPLGFAFGLAYLWLAQPTVLSICIGAAIVVIGLAVRAIASGQLNKNEQLATSGPYSYTRNPLYLGSLLIGVGFALAGRNLWVWILLLAMFTAIYIPVIRSEESFLRSTFPDFESYSRRTPRLLPRWSGQSLTAQFSGDLYLKHREYNASIGAALMMIAIIVKMIITKSAGT